MSITFECGHCGRYYDLPASKAGKVGRCKDCRRKMYIPPRSTTRPVPTWLDDDDADATEAALAPTPTPAREALPPRVTPIRASREQPTGSVGPRPRKMKAKRSARTGFWRGPATPRGRLVLAVFLLWLAYGSLEKGYQHRHNVRHFGWFGSAPIATRMPTTIDEAGDLIRQQVARTEAAPQSLPTFPVLGPGRMIEPGVMLHEVNLGPLNTSVDSLQAAQGGRLWVYLPSASAGATDHKLPCVLMTAAGTNLLSGIELSEADQRVAHLPFARAGFAVVAFELDGSVAENAPSRVLNEAGYRFLRARAGLANAHVAFEYTRQMIPAIDPTRISIAGHSSAGVVALLFAATEPKLRSAVAFAPAVDIEARFGPAAVATVQRSGFGDLAVRYSPTNYCQKLLCPVFLFAARDDSNTPFREAETFANRFRNRGEPLTFDTVNKGDHYQSMVDQGIPHAIAWLRGRPIPADDSLVVRPTSRPAQTLTPPGPTPQPGQSTSLDQAIAGRTKAQQDRVRAQIEAMRQRQDEIRNRMRNRTRP